MLSKQSKYQDPEKIIKLFLHECERTYGDRLVSLQHVNKYKDIMYDIVKKIFPRYNFGKFFTGSVQENIIFSDFPNEEGERIYE